MLSIIFVTYFFAALQVAQQPPTTCLPPFWGGVLAGGSTKEDVLRLYGPGIFVAEEGDSDGHSPAPAGQGRVGTAHKLSPEGATA